VDASGAALAAGAQTFILMATPAAGSTQVGDGTVSVSESGKRSCNPSCGPDGNSSW
jgi:hypothetical protein